MEYVKLEEICTIVSGGTPSRSKPNYWNNGNIPWIKIKDMKSKYIDSAEEFITEEGLNNSSTKMLKSDTILYSIFATLGEVGILKIDACTNQAIAGLSLKEDSNILKEYLYYYLKSKKKDVNNLGRGVAQNNINLSLLRKFKIPVIPLRQQKRIIEVLDNVSSTINNYEREIDLLDELVKARFVEMFGDPIENQKDWEVVKIRDIVTDVRYGTSKPAVEGGRYPYLRMNNLTVDGGLDLSDLKYIDIPDNEIEKCVVRKGDILFNRTNSIDLIGKTAVFNLLDDMVIAGYIIRIRLNNQILPDVFSQYMNLEAMKKVLRGMAKGAVNQANINAQELQSIKVYIPDMELQKQYVEFKEEIDKSRLLSNHSLFLIKSLIF